MLIFSSTNMKINFELSQLTQTSVELKKHIKNNVVLISGEMGAGKTTLIKELLRLMDVEDKVSSPTFSIVNEYVTSHKETIYHMDLYRIKDTEELNNIGLFEYIESGKTCFIEWGEMIEKSIYSDYNKFVISKVNKSRSIKKIR